MPVSFSRAKLMSYKIMGAYQKVEEQKFKVKRR
jgi:hypothetical protein